MVLEATAINPARRSALSPARALLPRQPLLPSLWPGSSLSACTRPHSPQGDDGVWMGWEVVPRGQGCIYETFLGSEHQEDVT